MPGKPWSGSSEPSSRRSNRPGFYERSIYVNPEDNDNMNRVFPGRPDGTWSERFAHHFLNDVIAGANYAIDLHAGDMIEDLVPFVGLCRDGTGGGRSDGAADARRVRRCLGHQDAAERRACRPALRRRCPARPLGDPGGVRAVRPAGRGGGPAPRRRRPQHPADARHPGGRAGRRRPTAHAEPVRLAALGARGDSSTAPSRLGTGSRPGRCSARWSTWSGIGSAR